MLQLTVVCMRCMVARFARSEAPAFTNIPVAVLCLELNSKLMGLHGIQHQADKGEPPCVRYTA